MAKRAAKRAETIELGTDELEAAETYLRAKAEEKRAKADKDAAKEVLMTALGDCKSGVLPDGRRVIKTVTEYPEGDFHRAAYTAASLTIG